MDQEKLAQDVDAGNAAIHVHQHQHLPRPVSVADDDGARAVFGWRHRRTTYRALGVACADLPNGRFAVLVADVEAALRERAKVAPGVQRRHPQPAKVVDAADDDRALLERSGLRLAGGER